MIDKTDINGVSVLEEIIEFSRSKENTDLSFITVIDEWFNGSDRDFPITEPEIRWIRENLSEEYQAIVFSRPIKTTIKRLEAKYGKLCKK